MIAILMSGCGGHCHDNAGAAPWHHVYGPYCQYHPGPGCDYFNGPIYPLGGDHGPAISPTSGGVILGGDGTTHDGLVISPTSGGVIQSDDGYSANAYSYEATLNSDANDSRDLIADEASQESKVISLVGHQFAQMYALSETKGFQIAKTLNDYAALSKKQKRARTPQDLDDFSVRLYGMSADKVKSAIDQARMGNIDGLESINYEVATHWGTTPETSKTILKNWYKGYLSEVGLQ
jgi:hypothetical protein